MQHRAGPPRSNIDHRQSAPRRRADEALRESEERYRIISEVVSDFVYSFRIEPDGAMVGEWANEAATRTVGYTMLEFEELGGWQRLLHADDLQQASEIKQRLLEGETVEAELRIVTKAGQTRWLSVYIKPIWNLREKCVVKIYGGARDITKRKLAEQELRASEKRFSRLFYANPIPMAFGESDGGRLIVTNERFSEFFGYSGNELIRLDADALWFDPAQRAQVLSIVRERGRVAGVEARLRTKSGELREVLLAMELIPVSDESMLVTMLVDITKRKEAERLVSSQSARAQLLADLSQAFAQEGLDFEALLNAVVRRTAELIGDSCVITLFSEDGQRAFPVAFHHPDPWARDLLHDGLIEGWQGGTDTARYQTLMTGETTFMPNVNAADYRAVLEPEFWPYMDEVGISSSIIVPLRVGSRVIGTLGITRDRLAAAYAPEDRILMQDLADRAALALQNARLFQSVEEQSARLRRLSARLVEAQEAERRHIGRELHDEIGQVLTALKILLETAPLSTTAEALGKVNQARLLADDLIDRVGRLSLDLRPSMLDDLGLLPALLWHIDRFTRQTELEVEFSHLGLEGRRFNTEVETAAYRILQEGLTNVARHANSNRVLVKSEADGERISLLVQDFGQAFDAQAALTAESSGGLSGMRERALLLGGRFEIHSQPGQGTSISVELPLSKKHGNGKAQKKIALRK